MARTKAALTGAILAILVAGAANAGTIGPNCGTCQGSTYTLTYNSTPIAVGKTWSLWQIILTIDSRGFNGDGTNSIHDYIDEVAIKVSSAVASGKGIPSPSLVAFTERIATTPTYNASNWTVQSGGLNASGCSGAGSGYVCADYNSSKKNPGVPVNNVYKWVFDVPVATGALFTSSSELSSIKARYVNASGTKVGALVSEDLHLSATVTARTPEPGSILLLFTAIAGIVWKTRSRRALAVCARVSGSES